MKKRCSILLTACLMIAALTGCSQTQTVEQTSAQTTEVQQTEETLQEKEAQTFSIGYPSYLQESQGKALVLEEKPEDIVVLSNSALQILVACGIANSLICEMRQHRSESDLCFFRAKNQSS